MVPLKLIVGLGNPGPQFERTRHNVGAVWVENLARRYSIAMKEEAKFKGFVGRGVIEGVDLRLLIPTTFMNLSGESVGAVMRFYKIDVASLLVAYDEMAFSPGVVKLKLGGGDNGHNGLKSVRSGCGNQADFHRLRIGVGHPGHKSRVTAYLTQVKMPASEEQQVESALEMAPGVLHSIVQGDWQAAMNTLHAATTEASPEKDKGEAK